MAAERLSLVGMKSSDTQDEEERRLRIELMQADIENKRIDTRYKKTLADWEPWKAMAVAAGAGATLMLALIAIITALVRMH
jgi:hypothetical protein